MEFLYLIRPDKNDNIFNEIFKSNTQKTNTDLSKKNWTRKPQNSESESTSLFDKLAKTNDLSRDDLISEQPLINAVNDQVRFISSLMIFKRCIFYYYFPRSLNREKIQKHWMLTLLHLIVAD